MFFEVSGRFPLVGAQRTRKQVTLPVDFGAVVFDEVRPCKRPVTQRAFISPVSPLDRTEGVWVMTEGGEGPWLLESWE